MNKQQPSAVDGLAERLSEIRDRGLGRALQEPSGLDFSSNDYLGLSSHPDLHRHVSARLDSLPVTGAPASRLLRGHLDLHQRLEQRLATFKGTEAALLYPSGWQSNIGLLTAVVRKQDRVLSDALNHASIIDGIRLSGCHKVIVPHLNTDALADELARPWPGRTYVVTESLFSMDGDVAPLDRYADLCDAYDAALMVDDAHATGLWGDARGSGLVEHFGVVDRTLAIVSTGGKALGTSGGFVAGSRTLIDFLINTSRSFIFSTAVSPLLVHALEGALDVVQCQPDLRLALHRNADFLRRRLRHGGLGPKQLPETSRGPIVPVIVGDNAPAMAAAQALQDDGFDVRAIRPPTVAPGTARLRISVHADHRRADLERLAAGILNNIAPSSLESAVGARS